MIIEEYRDVILEETDQLDRYGLPIYIVSNGTKVKAFANGELAYTDALRYYNDTVMWLVYGYNRR